MKQQRVVLGARTSLSMTQFLSSRLQQGVTEQLPLAKASLCICQHENFSRDLQEAPTLLSANAQQT